MPLPPNNPCAPVPPTPPPTSPSDSIILAILHEENVIFKKTRDSVWNLARSHNWEYKFLIGIKNDIPYIIGIKTDSMQSYVTKRYQVNFNGYYIIGDYHTHQDSLPIDRFNHDPQDISESNFTHDNKKKLYYRSYVDTGDTLYAIVNENLSKMKAFSMTHNFENIQEQTWRQLLGFSSNRRRDGLILLLQLLGLSSSSGVGIYKSINADKTIFKKIN